MRPRRGAERSVARRVLLLQALVVVVLVVTAVGLAVLDARRDVRDDARDRAVAVALSVARTTLVRDVLGTEDASQTLRLLEGGVRREADVDFVSIMDLDRSATAAPAGGDPTELAGAAVSATQGEVTVEDYDGALGASVRAVAPVYAGETGDVVAVVAVGVALDSIDAALLDELRNVLLAALAVLGVGLAGAWLINHRLRRQTHGLGEQEITRMYEYYRAVLHAVREGLLLVDGHGRVQLVNDEARRLLDLPEDAVGRSVEELGLPPALAATATADVPDADELYVTGDRVLLASSSPAYWEGREVGAVLTLRDHTELQALTGELDVVRGLTESLRAQTHEAANRLHTVVSLVEMGRQDEAVAFATEELQIAQLLTDRLVEATGEPVVAALLVGKSAEAAERGVRLTVTGRLPPLSPEPGTVTTRELVTVVGNLVDNALDAVAGRDDRRVVVHLDGSPDRLGVVVSDSGPGMTPDQAARVLERGWTTKAGPDGAGRGVGLALVARIARRRHGAVTIGRSGLGGAELAVTLGRAPDGSPGHASEPAAESAPGRAPDREPVP
ncbi:MAG: sensor histidine kinase [Kineosporiaceae bacterium]